MKQTIRLTESELRGMIQETVKEVLKEGKYVNNKPGFTGSAGNFTTDALKYHMGGKYKELKDVIDNAPDEETRYKASKDFCIAHDKAQKANDIAFKKHKERQDNKDYYYEKNLAKI